jgi:peptidoglycan/xylan/chitin deacetylase (PgdA/CDA1 family)
MERSCDVDHRTTKTSAVIAVLATLMFISCHKPAPTIQKVSKNYTVVLKKVSHPKPLKKKTKKKVYITFDDGPNKGTANVLHIVQNENVPVSFFIVGEHAFASPAQAKLWDSLTIAEHIDICNHSYTHANNRYEKFYQRPDSVVKDFQRAHDSLNLTNKIVRTPGRNIWRIDSLNYTDIKSSADAADSLQKAGFIVMGWDLEWQYDHKSMSVTTTADKMIAQIDSAFAKKQTRYNDHLVLLAHDQVYNKPDDSIQLRRFLQALKLKEEYELVLVTAYPGAGSKQ